MCLRSLGGGRVSGGWLPRAGTPRSRPSLFLRRNSSKTTRATSKSSVKVKVGRISLTESKNCQNVGALPGSMSKLLIPLYTFGSACSQNGHRAWGVIQPPSHFTSCFMFIKACCFSKIMPTPVPKLYGSDVTVPLYCTCLAKIHLTCSPCSSLTMQLTPPAQFLLTVKGPTNSLPSPGKRPASMNSNTKKWE